MAVHIHLEVDEQFEVLVLLLRVFLHELREGLALDVFRDDRPLAVNREDLFDLRDTDAGLLDARLVERFVQDIGHGIITVKYLNAVGTVAVHGFVVSYRNHSVQFHRIS